MSAGVREVVLGVGAGIAAYKSCDLLRRLQDRGYVITVVPTPSSLNFVGAATWQALSGRPVTTQVWENTHEVSHISIAERSDFFLIAPATADLIARIAIGRADDLLTNLVLASDVPIMIVTELDPSTDSAPTSSMSTTSASQPASGISGIVTDDDDDENEDDDEDEDEDDDDDDDDDDDEDEDDEDDEEYEVEDDD